MFYLNVPIPVGFQTRVNGLIESETICRGISEDILFLATTSLPTISYNFIAPYLEFVFLATTDNCIERSSDAIINIDPSLCFVSENIKCH